MHRAGVGAERDGAFGKDRDQIAQRSASGEIERGHVVKMPHDVVGEFGFVGTAEQHRKQRGTVGVGNARRGRITAAVDSGK